jgi:hypothetical protein
MSILKKERRMTAMLTRTEPHVEQDEFVQAPAKFADPQPNGDAGPHDDRTSDSEPTLAEAQAILAKVTEEAQGVLARAIGAERGAIDALKAERDALDKTIDDREAALAKASGGKVRKKRQATETRKPDENTDITLPGNPAALMLLDKPYTSNQCKAIFDGKKPGEVLADAIAAKLVKIGGKGGAGRTYTRTK